MEGTPGRHNLGRPLVGGAGQSSGYWAGAASRWEKPSPKAPSRAFPSFDTDWKEKNAITVVAERRVPDGPSKTSLAKVVQAAVNLLRKAEGRVSRLNNDLHEKTRRWEAYQAELRTSFIQEYRNYVSTLDRLEQEGCGSCFAGGASTGAACAGYEWCRTGRAFRRCEPSMGASDGWHSGRPDHGHRRRCYWTAAGRAVGHWPDERDESGGDCASEGTWRATFFWACAKEALYCRVARLCEGGSLPGGQSHRDLAKPQSAPGHRRAPARDLSSSCRAEPGHQSKYQTCPTTWAAFLGLPGRQIDRGTTLRHGAFRQNAGSDNRHDGGAQGAASIADPHQHGYSAGCDNDDELDTAAPGRASPGLGRME